MSQQEYAGLGPARSHGFRFRFARELPNIYVIVIGEPLVEGFCEIEARLKYFTDDLTQGSSRQYAACFFDCWTSIDRDRPRGCGYASITHDTIFDSRFILFCQKFAEISLMADESSSIGTTDC